MISVCDYGVLQMELHGVTDPGPSDPVWKYVIGGGLPGTWIGFELPLTKQQIHEKFVLFKTFQEVMLNHLHLHTHGLAVDVRSQIPELYELAQAHQTSADLTSRSRRGWQTKTHLAVIPGLMTAILQPLDV